MPTLLTAADHAAIGSIDLSLEQARNAADGNAFGAAFATDADFVNVRPEHHRGVLRTRPGTMRSCKLSTRGAAITTA